MLVGPDGLVTEETAFAAVRFEDETAEDGWRDIDTTLVAGARGEIRPAAEGAVRQVHVGDVDVVADHCV